MKQLLAALLCFVAVIAVAQVPNRSVELEKAYQEARTAAIAFENAQKRRDEGLESQAGERSAAGGGTRPNENYFARQAILEQQLEQARQRYEAATRRWNDLK